VTAAPALPTSCFLCLATRLYDMNVSPVLLVLLDLLDTLTLAYEATSPPTAYTPTTRHECPLLNIEGSSRVPPYLVNLSRQSAAS
jgi:hypothetical protein